MRRLGWLIWSAAALWGSGVLPAQQAPGNAAAPAAGAAPAASGTTLVSLPVPLLGPRMGAAVRSGEAVTGDDPAQADAAHADALHEDGLQRFARATYGTTPVQALQFNDASGARAAYGLYLQGGGSPAGGAIKGADEASQAGDRRVVLAQSVVLIAEKDAPAAMVADIVSALPKIGGPRSQRPLLPTLLPERGLVGGSARYALGPAGYAADGGVLPPGQLGWEKSGEAVTARYADRRGKETLTLLLYPTPQIAGEHARLLEKLGSGARVRREGELVAVAQGAFSADDAQNLVENVHLRNEVSFDKPMPLEFPTEIRKTYSLMRSIAVLSGVGGLAAVLLGLFLGGGRAAFRVMRGKDAATEAEFLSLHLDPQNEKPRFDPPSS